VQACAKGVPILAEELKSFEQREKSSSSGKE